MFGLTTIDRIITTAVVIIYVVLNIIHDSNCECVRGAVENKISILKLKFNFLMNNQAFENIFKMAMTSICVYLSRISSILIFWNRFGEPKCNIKISLWFYGNYSCAFAKQYALLFITQTQQLSTWANESKTQTPPLTIETTSSAAIGLIDASREVIMYVFYM